ncbi:hypothetical protein [Anoxybacillus ayderensis]|uniref:hypothetical protein n=1 Tax=Anoxybacillus ayderensis TaxID=265546 RepID=UPI002E213775|nr:hypothetical protein [Anoxybacillus ayderensis]
MEKDVHTEVIILKCMYIDITIAQSAIRIFIVIFGFVFLHNIEKRYGFADKKIKMKIWLPSLIGALCLAVFLYEIDILPGK